MAIEAVAGFVCERCGHVWANRPPVSLTELVKEKVVPRICPMCKSQLWNTPKERKANGNGQSQQ